MATNRQAAAQRWWELMQQDQYGISTGNIGWNQLPASTKEKLTNYFNDTLVPKMEGQTLGSLSSGVGSPMSYDMAVGLGLSGRSSDGTANGDFLYDSSNDAGLESLARELRGEKYLPTLRGYDKRKVLPQTAILYAIDPQLAESIGITYDRALTDANLFGEQHNEAQQASDSASNREGWLMALGTIGAGVGGAYMNGTLGGTGSSGLTAAEQNALMGGLGDTTADIGAGILDGGASIYDGATLGGSFVDPTTGLTYGANGLGGGTGLGNLGTALEGTGLSSATVLQTLATQGIKGVASLLSGSGLASTAINGILNNLLKNSARDDMNQVWDTVTSGITNANQLRDLAGPARSMLSDQSFLNSAKSGITGLQDMFNNPNNYAGYGAATTANTAAQNFINDPMSDPGVRAALQIGAENTARKSSSGRGLNSGSFMAEQNAANLANLAGLRQETLGAYGATANAGMNQFNGLADIGTKGVNAAISGANANTAQGIGAANAANAHLNALGTAANSFVSPMIGIQALTDPTMRNLQGITSGQTNWSPVINGGLDWLSKNVFGSNS